MGCYCSRTVNNNKKSKVRNLKRVWLWGEGFSTHFSLLSSSAPALCQWCITSWQKRWPRSYRHERYWQMRNPSIVGAGEAENTCFSAEVTPYKVLGGTLRSWIIGASSGWSGLRQYCQPQPVKSSWSEERKQGEEHSFSIHTSKIWDWVESSGLAEISTCAALLEIVGVGNENKAVKMMFWKENQDSAAAWLYSFKL